MGSERARVIVALTWLMAACSSPEREELKRALTPTNTRPASTGRGTTSTDSGAAYVSNDISSSILWKRLRATGKPLRPVSYELPEAMTRELGIRSYGVFESPAPRVWILVFEFAQRPTEEVHRELKDAFGRSAPPYYAEGGATGDCLGFAGFPSDKPPSTPMISARDDWLDILSREE